MEVENIVNLAPIFMRNKVIFVEIGLYHIACKLSFLLTFFCIQITYTTVHLLFVNDLIFSFNIQPFALRQDFLRPQAEGATPFSGWNRFYILSLPNECPS